MTKEDEAFNDIERQAKQRKESVRAAMRSVEEDDDIQVYQRPWVGLTEEDMKGMSYGDKVLATWVARTLKEKNT